MKKNKKSKTQSRTLVVRVVAIVCAVLIFGSVIATALIYK